MATFRHRARRSPGLDASSEKPLIKKAPSLKFQILLKPEPSPESALPAEIAIADAIGRLMQFWGFKRPMGRIWAVLYLSPQPMSAAQLGEILKMSTGAVSMALAELEKWSAVMRTWIPGVRRDYFVAESDIWKMVQRVIRERELTLVVDFGQSVRMAEIQVSDLEKGADDDLQSALTYKRERLRRLSDLSLTGETLLKALVAGDSVDPTLLIQRPQ